MTHRRQRTPGVGADDKINFTFTLTSPGGGDIIRIAGTSTSKVIDKYSSMTQVLAPHAVDSATANGAGGFDYVIGSEGWPALLTYSQAGDCFGLPPGSVDCPHLFTGVPPEPDFWDGTTTAGIGSLESNFGAKTVGTVTNLQCIDSKSTSGLESNDCRDSRVAFAPWVIGPCAVPGGCTGNASTPGSHRGGAEDVGWDQLLLKVSTNAAGNVIAVAGFDVEETAILGSPTIFRCGDNTDGTLTYSATCNTWSSGYFMMTPAVDDHPDAVDHNSSVDRGGQINIDVLANDTALTDTPIHVYLHDTDGGLGAPTLGTVAVVNNHVVYTTSNTSNVGPDSFEYRVTDADGDTDVALVSVTIDDHPEAHDDVGALYTDATWGADVLSNDTGLTDGPLTLTVTEPNLGTAVPDCSPCSHPSINYTPPGGGFTGNVVFTYRITDASGDVSQVATMNLSVRITPSRGPNEYGARAREPCPTPRSSIGGVCCDCACRCKVQWRRYETSAQAFVWQRATCWNSQSPR